MTTHDASSKGKEIVRCKNRACGEGDPKCAICVRDVGVRPHQESLEVFFCFSLSLSLSFSRACKASSRVVVALADYKQHKNESLSLIHCLYVAGYSAGSYISPYTIIDSLNAPLYL